VETQQDMVVLHTLQDMVVLHTHRVVHTLAVAALPDRWAAAVHTLAKAAVAVRPGPPAP